ncbi:MAG: gliding motility lipoprotein GldH [Flavobacteriales bacterium]|nr:gliding motility lipoprotein GldH [Flavobacteriales bacterium]
MRIRENKYIVLGLLLVALLVASCADADVLMEDTRPIGNQSWSSSDTVEFEFAIDDTTAYFDFYLNLRTTTSYEYANCYVFATLKSPTMIVVDTINIPLADGASGRWLGDVSGSMVENHVMFIHKVRFHELGSYDISFVQGMREDPLSEISDVGLTIKKVNE